MAKLTARIAKKKKKTSSFNSTLKTLNALEIWFRYVLIQCMIPNCQVATFSHLYFSAIYLSASCGISRLHLTREITHPKASPFILERARSKYDLGEGAQPTTSKLKWVCSGNLLVQITEGHRRSI